MSLQSLYGPNGLTQTPPSIIPLSVKDNESAQEGLPFKDLLKGFVTETDYLLHGRFSSLIAENKLPCDTLVQLLQSRYVNNNEVPSDYAEHIRLLGDLMVLAFQTDTTRVSTFVFANEGSNRSYGFIGVPDGHHDLSHHESKEEKLEKIRKINRFHVEQFAYIVGRMKEIKEGEGTLLDNSMIVYGSGIGDGNRHNHDDLPVVMAGRAGGSIDTGRHIKYENGTPMTNLFLSMLDRMHAEVESLGDSSGRLSQLKG